jgi:hypothetical protein
LHCVFQDPVKKPGGRLLGDLTNRAIGNSINNIEARPAIVERYGQLTLPTIADIIRHINMVAKRVGGLHNVRIFKEDVVGAFGQFNFDPRDCRLVVFPFSSEHVMVYMTGMFGYSGCPFVFGTFTRAMLRRIRLKTHEVSESDMYCDDVMVYTGVDYAEDDQRIVVDVIEGTFGPNTACPVKKHLPSTRCDLIGWFVDVIDATFRPNDKGIDALTRSFLSLSSNTAINKREYQVLASLACRYSRGLLGMRPFVRSFFAMVKATRFGPKIPSTSAWTSIVMWQAVTICLILSPHQLAVPLVVFDEHDVCQVQVISDAGPEALGLAIYVDTECVGYVTYVLPFDSRSPSYQNCREFMGHLLGKILLLKLNYRNTNVSLVTKFRWTGDNMAALSWFAKQSCNSHNTQMAFLADCWLSTIHNVNTTSVDHRAGADMGDHDGLSRLRTHAFDPALNLNKLITSDVHELFTMCDPTATTESFSVNDFPRLITLLSSIHKSSS